MTDKQINKAAERTIALSQNLPKLGFDRALENAQRSFLSVINNNEVAFRGEITNQVFAWCVCRFCRSCLPYVLSFNQKRDAKCKVYRCVCVTCAANRDLDLKYGE